MLGVESSSSLRTAVNSVIRPGTSSALGARYTTSFLPSSTTWIGPGRHLPGFLLRSYSSIMKCRLRKKSAECLKCGSAASCSTYVMAERYPRTGFQSASAASSGSSPLDRGYRIFDSDVEALNGIRCPDCTGEQRSAQQARPSLGGLHSIFQDLLEIVDAADYVNLQLVESWSLEKHSVIPLTTLLYTVTIDIKYLLMKCRRRSLQLLHPRRAALGAPPLSLLMVDVPLHFLHWALALLARQWDRPPGLSSILLEIRPHHELDPPRSAHADRAGIKHARDPSETCRGYVARRDTERRVIQQVVSRGAQTQAHPLRHPEPLLQRGVHLVVSRPEGGIAAQVAPGPIGRRGKCRRIEPLVDRLVGRIDRNSGNQVRPL